MKQKELKNFAKQIVEAEKIIKDYSQSIENFEKTYISAVLSHMRKLSQHQTIMKIMSHISIYLEMV